MKKLQNSIAIKDKKKDEEIEKIKLILSEKKDIVKILNSLDKNITKKLWLSQTRIDKIENKIVSFQKKVKKPLTKKIQSVSLLSQLKEESILNDLMSNNILDQLL